MRIVSQLMNDISGIELFPLIALFMFVLFFMAIAIHTLSMKKDRDEALGRIPLEEEETIDNFES